MCDFNNFFRIAVKAGGTSFVLPWEIELLLNNINPAAPVKAVEAARRILKLHRSLFMNLSNL